MNGIVDGDDYADEFALSFNLAKYGDEVSRYMSRRLAKTFLIHVGTGDN